ncbi:MAG: hypothetical protein NC453_17620 [Muribaculum sp.]|nr:hypothetical protein [Muribaculum sp.]
MIYIFSNVFPGRTLLQTKNLTSDFVDKLYRRTEVILDDTFDKESVVDIATLDAAQKLYNDLLIHNIHTNILLTRKYPVQSHEYKLVLDLPKKISGIDSYVSQFLGFSRIEIHEIASFNEILHRITPTTK